VLRRLPLRWPAALLATGSRAGRRGDQRAQRLVGPAEPARRGTRQDQGVPTEHPRPTPPGTAGPAPGSLADPASAPPEPGEPSPEPLDGRRRFRRASLLGALLALVPNLALLVGGGFLRRIHLGGFYDAQAHSLLDLRWHVPRDVLSLEAFVVDGRSYMYFGPTPALLRLPVAAVTDRFDGRLTSLSLLLALGVALVATADLGWRVRRLLRGDAPVTAVDAWAAAGSTFLVGAGSVLLFLSSAPVVYHEAIAWGVALALAADAALLAHLTDRRPRALAAAVVLAALAVLARPSVGLGPVFALGLLAAAEGVAVLRTRDGRRARRFVLLSACAALPVVLYVAVNLAKFDTPAGVPWRNQAAVATDDEYRDFLDENDGSLFGSKYVPTALVAYLAPGALSVDRVLPWIDFPGRVGPVSDVRFLVIDRTPSLLTTMPWLVGLAVTGVIVLTAGRSGPERRTFRALWPLVAGALAAVPVTLAIAYIAARYLADFVPLLVLPALAGLHALVARRHLRWAKVGLGVAGVLGLAAVAVNLAVAVRFHGLYGPAAEEEQRARLVRWQTRANDFLPGDQSPHVRRIGAEGRFPLTGRPGDLTVVGDCIALYQHNGSSWRPVEQTPEAGRLRLRTTLDAPGAGQSSELLAGGSGDARRSLAVEVQDDGRVVLVLETAGRTARSSPIEVGSGTAVVDASFDRRLHGVEVEVDDRVVATGALYSAPDDRLEVSPGWPGDVELLPHRAPACEGLGD
jgi:hypothetical protein